MDATVPLRTCSPEHSPRSDDLACVCITKVGTSSLPNGSSGGGPVDSMFPWDPDHGIQRQDAQDLARNHFPICIEPKTTKGTKDFGSGSSFPSFPSVQFPLPHQGSCFGPCPQAQRRQGMGMALVSLASWRLGVAFFQRTLWPACVPRSEVLRLPTFVLHTRLARHHAPGWPLNGTPRYTPTLARKPIAFSARPSFRS